LKESTVNVGRALTPDEELRLFTTAENNPDWFVACHAAIVANHTGMRGVELRNLRIRDLDLDHRQITIRRSKTDSGIRTIELTNEAIKAFAKLRGRAIALGAPEPDHFVIPARDQATCGFDPARPTKGWRTAWRALTRKAGLPGFRFHDLRHSFITAHAEAGTPIAVLQAQVGHLVKKMTEHYTHISNRAIRKAQEKFEREKLSLRAEAVERTKEQASATSVN
jgi:integrase